MRDDMIINGSEMTRRMRRCAREIAAALALTIAAGAFLFATLGQGNRPNGSPVAAYEDLSR